MVTLDEYVVTPGALDALLNAEPNILNTIGIACYSATFTNPKGEVNQIKRGYIAYNPIFYLEVRSQIDCFLIAHFKAQKVLSVTIHHDKS